MSKKKLLEESTIRSFMKLANLQPLTNKFLKESEHEEEKGEKEDEEKEEEELKEEMSEEEGDVTEEAKTQKPGKMDAAKNAAPDAKLKPLKAGTHHSDKPDSIETKDHSNAPKKNNSQHEVVSENLEEIEMEAEEEMTGSDAAGESEQHQETVKDAIQKILGAVSQIAQEYGVEMDVQSGEEEMEPEAPPADMAPEAPEAEDEKMMEAKLEEMVEKLTKRVAARLVKESKKKH